MTRCLFIVAASLLGAAAGAQTTPTSQPAGLDTQSPQQNVRIGRVAERAPNTIVSEAIARHNGLRDNRESFQHSGLAQNAGGSSNSSSSNSTTGGLDTSSLSNLLGSFLSGGGLNLVQSANLFGNSGSSNSTSTSTSTNTNSNIPSNITPEVIQMLQGAGIDINDVFPPSGSNSSSAKALARQQSNDAPAQNILLDRWPNKPSTLQTSTGTTTNPSSSDTYDNDPNFRVRWSNAMLSTLFTGLVVGMQTPDFITLLKDAIRPFIFDVTNTSTPASSSTTPSGNAKSPAKKMLKHAIRGAIGG